MTDDRPRRPPLDSDRLGDLLAEVPDLAVEVRDEVESTNAAAAARAMDGAPDGTVVVAEHQTAGRGRLDREWVSPPGSGLAFTLVVRPEVPSRSWPWIPLLAGYSVAKTLSSLGYAAGVKWPNDVQLDGEKVAGILAEQVATPQGPAVCVGVGLNVDLDPDELPVAGATALSLQLREPTPEARAEVGPLDRTSLLAELLLGLRETYDAWAVGGDDAGLRLQESYTAACVSIGEQVRVELPDGGVLVGEAVRIAPGGQLVVATGEGEQAVDAGDVTHARILPESDQ